MRTYDPLIYPVSIVLSCTEEELNKKYELPDGGDIEKQQGCATTYRVNGRNGGSATVGIVFRRKPDIDTIAHEAFHAAHDIMSYIHEDFVYDGTNESWAYLIGWIALCIEDFVNKEFKEEKK